MNKWLTKNQGIGAVLLIVFTALFIYIQLSSWASEKLRDEFSLGFFPSIAIVLAIIFSFIIIIDSRRNEVLPGLELLTLKATIFPAAAVITCWIYLELMKKIGFIIATPIFLCVAMFSLGLKSWRNLIIASPIMTVVVYAIFRVMGIDLPVWKL